MKKTPSLVRFRANPSARLRLFCFHFAGGSASVFRSWAPRLSGDLELWAVQLPGREERFQEAPRTDLGLQVAEIVEDIRGCLDKPYIVFGHSLGAILAFEAIREIQRMGWRMPDLFIPSGHHAPQLSHRNPPYYGPSDREVLQRLRSYKGTPEEVLNDGSLMEALLPRLRADFRMIATYRYRPGPRLPCPVLAFDGAEDENVNVGELFGWEDQSAHPFEYRRFRGGHFFIKSEEAEVVGALNETARALLEGKRAGAPEAAELSPQGPATA